MLRGSRAHSKPLNIRTWPARTLRALKTVDSVLNIGRHCIISSAIRKIGKGKQFVRKFGNFLLPNGMNICSGSLDRETTFIH